MKLAPFISDGRGNLTLYEHQADLMRRMLDKLIQGYRVKGYMATGGGKTETAFGVIEEWLALYPRARVHFVAHRQELVHQPCIRAARYNIDIRDAWRPSGSSYGPESRHANSVGKMRSALRNGDISIAPNDLLLMDESHHAEYRTRMGQLAIEFAELGGKVAGFTGTPWRLSRKQGFLEVFDVLELGPQTAELVQQGYLANPVITIPRGILAHMRSGLRRRDFTANGNLKDSALTSEARWSMRELPIQKWVEYGYEDMRTIFFEANTEMAVLRARQLRDMGKSVGLLLSNSKDERITKGDIAGVPLNRGEVMDGYAEGELQCLVNISMVGEGVDVADTECVLLNFASLSLARVMQSIGRVIRTSPGKVNGYIIDTGANTLDPDIGGPMHKRSWSLLPRGDDVDGSAPELALCVNEDCENAVHPSSKICPVNPNGCGAPQGEICPRCYKFARQFFIATARTGICPRCDREIAMLEQQGLAAAPRAGTFSRNWSALGETYGTGLSRDIIDAGEQRGEWGVVVDNTDGAISNGDFVESVSVKTRAGKIRLCRGYAIWMGQFYDMPRVAFLAVVEDNNSIWRMVTNLTTERREDLVRQAKDTQDSWKLCVVCNSNLHPPQYPFCLDCRKNTVITRATGSSS